MIIMKGCLLMDIRHIKANEIDQAIQLANGIFREKGHSSMGDAFPQVFSKGMNHSFGAFVDHKLVSFMGLVPAKINIGNAQVNVFSIGAVCTHEDYRQRGISSKLLEKVYQYIDQAGGTLLFISGDRGLYTRNHCYHFGDTYQYTIHQSAINGKDYEGLIRGGKAVDIFQIDKLRKENSVYFESSPWEWSTLLESSGYTSTFKIKQTLLVAEKYSDIQGYVVIGLPHKESKKQEAIVTEWGGDPKEVHGILKNLLIEKLTEEIKLTIPWHVKYHEEFSHYPVKQIQQGGTIYLANAERLIEQIRPYLKERDPFLANSIRIVQKSIDEFQLFYDQANLTLSRQELTEVLFNIKSTLRPKELQELFPIPLPLIEGIYYV